MVDTIHVILVDDDEEDYLLTADMLSEASRQSYALEWVSNAADAKARFAQNPPDICLLDYRLGPDDGISLIPVFQQAGFDGPIIMLTGQRDRDLEHAALAAGAVDYLSKQDVKAYDLERALRYAWMRRQAEMHERERVSEEARRREAEAANQAKSEFLAYISHELRTPLAAMLSYADLLSLQAQGGRIAEYTSAISRNGRHLQALLDDMVDLSLIESGKLELELQNTSLRQVIANVVSIAQVQCQSRELEFVQELPEALPELIATDKKRLTQMLFNLLGNAIKFTETGSVTFRVRFDTAAQTIVFEIEDTGPGIAENDIARIFEPFHRLDTSSERSSGIGLGLTITARLAEYLHASVDVRSEVGKGTCFTLTLPATNATRLQALSREDLLHPGLADNLPDSLEGLIAIVDDAEDIRISLSELLRKLGASVLTLGSGNDLLQMITADEASPDLILLDMQMPGIDGYETARRLRELGVETPIIALTAAAFEGAREKCIAAGCNDYVSKPAEPTRLFRRIAEWLDASRQSDLEHTGTLDILVIDDARDGREALRDLLELQGFSVQTAASQQEAQQMVQSHEPHCLLVDINLGTAGSGIALAQQLRGDPERQHVKIIGLSGRAFEELAADERELFDAFMTKPVDLQHILQTLASCGISA